jgi:hypothetical protein
MLLSCNTYKTLDDLNQDEMRLGGLRINPTTNISSSVTYINNIKLRKIKEKTKFVTVYHQIQNLISWSPNEKKIAFQILQNWRIWVVDVASAQAKQLTDYTVNANLGNPFSWYKDNENILVKCFLNRAALLDEKKTSYWSYCVQCKWHLIEPTKIY